MLSIEQRVRIVGERMSDHNQLFTDLRHGLRQFEERVDRRFEQVDTRLTALGAEMTSLRRDMGTQFRWTAGILFTGLIAIIGAIIAQ